MDRYGMCGKIVAKPGQRDALLEILLQASTIPMQGCELYIVCKSPAEEDTVWIIEVWQSEADHQASLKLDSVRALITKARPMMAGGTEGIKLIPVGGKGLSCAGSARLTGISDATETSCRRWLTRSLMVAESLPRGSLIGR